HPPTAPVAAKLLRGGRGASRKRLERLDSIAPPRSPFRSPSRKDSPMNHLVEAVYEELRAIARAYLRRERRDHTLQATALVHEAFARLVEHDLDFGSREHFLGSWARTMR